MPIWDSMDDVVNKKPVIASFVGTRPELIKMAPILLELKANPNVCSILINTGQHQELVDDMWDIFHLTPDIELQIMTTAQTLGSLTSRLTHHIEKLFQKHRFDFVIAAGDTTTVFISALVAFYHHVPFGHIEAGLRSYNHQEPFPEEINRILAAPLSTLHFSPTVQEKQNLINEGIDANKIIVTGNPVIDAMHWVLQNDTDMSLVPKIDHFILVTTHRRENFNERLENICLAILELSKKFKNVHFVFPVHPNPNVQKQVNKLMTGVKTIHLIKPLRYDAFIYLLKKCLFVMTDSGGIQEEAPALGKPVLVLRNHTERLAIITENAGKLVGTDKDTIIYEASQLLTSQKAYTSLVTKQSPYGDGHASERIINALINYINTSSL